ncbi:hypothetical protein RHMOL_Rhmol03G0124100 [Rhododendron molle]|uniref:Uncharacterized protein n=1 Tax=Rhododendron molle TaxID=49168 RepID=A0ACC0PF33_RHOML|nr:hypothetical protein RHMOL_Rhmol03G0124100 [Rhododendron molle]
MCAATCRLETPQHLFLHCRFPWAVWSCIVHWWHVKWVCPSSVGALIAWWFGNRFRNLEKEIWESCLYATLWSLWLLQNDCVFFYVSLGCGGLNQNKGGHVDEDEARHQVIFGGRL